ncbi:MAG TPA: squalene synthase HpnD, partial [Rhizobiales bacterium]|nr:squalene synthase HpnD [Hyphomicrobiales bacterium]
INALYDNQPPKYSIVQALKQPVHDFHLRREDFLAVIDGMQMDADGPVIAPEYDELDLYCDRVASAVGRLCVGIFGEPGEKGLLVAFHQGRALQLTNILRDVAEDAAEGRLYLPREYLEEFQIPVDNLQDIMSSPGFPALWRKLARDAEQHYVETYRALGKCDRKKMRASYVMADIYHLNLQRMQKLSDDELANPLLNKRLVGKFEKLAIAAKSFRG